MILLFCLFWGLGRKFKEQKQTTLKVKTKKVYFKINLDYKG